MDEQKQQQGQNDQQENNNKIEKRYNRLFEQLVAVLNGDTTLFKKPKVKNDQVSAAVSEMVKGRQKKVVDKFITDLDTLVDKKIQFDVECAKAKKQFEEAELNKKKEFIKEMESLLNTIEDMNKYEAAYRKTLQAGVHGVAGEGVDKENEGEPDKSPNQEE